MRKTNKIIAMLIILCMLLLIVPFKVLALTDAEKEELVEIAMQNATNISISEDKATITYENGIVEITANNLQAYKNDNYDFVGDNIGTLWYLYIADTDVTFKVEPDDGYEAYYWTNGNQNKVTDNEYQMNELDKNSSYEIEFKFEIINQGGNNNPPPTTNKNYPDDIQIKGTYS